MTNSVTSQTKSFYKKWIPNKDLTMLKLLLFTYFGATHTLIPYLAIHMKQLGISVQETAIIHAALPISMFVGPPIAGFVADKFGGYKLLFIVSLFVTGGFHTALLWVPQMGAGPSYEGATIACAPAPSHGESGQLNLSYSAPLHQCARNEPTVAHFRRCTVHCPGRMAYDTVSHVGNESGSSIPCPPISAGTVENGGDAACIWMQTEKSGVNDSQTGNGRVTIFVQPSDTTENKAEKSGADGDAIYVSFVTTVNATDECPALRNDGCVFTCSIQRDERRHLPAVYCGSQALTFWLYVSIRIMGAIFMSSCYVLLDAITLTLVARGGTDYGKQRIWPVLATAVFPPIAGLLVDYMSELNNGVADYSPTFYVMDGLLVVTAFMSLFLTVNISLSSETSMRAVWQLVKTPRADWLFVALFVLGTLWGFVEVFLYWYLIDLGSPKYLLGLTMTVGSGVGIPTLYFAARIIRWVGHVYLVFIAFIFYCIRYVGLSFIVNPFWCLAFEAMEIFTLHLLWVSVVTFSASLAPKSLLATMQGAIGGTHYGVGRGSGSLVGGLLMGYLGARDAFRVMGIVAAVAGVIYLSVERIFFWTPVVPPTEPEVTNKDQQMDLESPINANKRKDATLQDSDDTKKTKL